MTWLCGSQRSPGVLVGSRQWHTTLPEPHTARLLVPAGMPLVSPCFAGSGWMVRDPCLRGVWTGLACGQFGLGLWHPLRARPKPEAVGLVWIFLW